MVGRRVGGCGGGSLDPGSSILGKDRCGRDASRAETPGGETAGGPVGLGSAARGDRAVGGDGAAWERCGEESGLVLRNGCEEPPGEWGLGTGGAASRWTFTSRPALPLARGFVHRQPHESRVPGELGPRLALPVRAVSVVPGPQRLRSTWV